MARSDEDLLLGDPEAFAAFYRRHAVEVSAFFLRRTADAEQVADLTAETFAVALQGRHRFDPERGTAVAWLYGIARHLLARALEKGRVETRARRRLGIPRLALDDEALERVEAASGDADLKVVLSELPADERAAVEARIVSERDYADIARDTATTEQTVRKRVSRGLARMRGRLEASR